MSTRQPSGLERFTLINSDGLDATSHWFSEDVKADLMAQAGSAVGQQYLALGTIRSPCRLCTFGAENREVLHFPAQK